MFIAHLPAGYLCGAAAQRCGLRARGLMAACLIGSLLPDADLFYCYLVDEGKVHHHLYPTHFPIIWLSLLALSGAACWFTKGKTWAIAASALSASALLHVALDGVAGDVPLFAPWDMSFYALTKVEPHYSPWWLNFLLHGSMLVELSFVFAAAFILIRRLHRRGLSPKHTS